MSELPAHTRGLNQTATYWPPGVQNGVGNVVHPDPILISCRWQDTATLFRTPSGEELTSSAIVYPDRALAIGGLLALGDFRGQLPGATRGTKEIRQTGASPNLAADKQLNKVYL